MDGIACVDHINIVVRDMEASLAFYCGLLGMEKTREARLTGPWIEGIVGLAGVDAQVAYVQPRGGGPRIELLEYAAPEGREFPEHGAANTLGLRHIAFQVPDIDAAYARLTAAGVAFLGPPTEVPTGVVAHDAGRKRLCYFHDPDGVLLELSSYTPEAH